MKYIFFNSLKIYVYNLNIISYNYDYCIFNN